MRLVGRSGVGATSKCVTITAWSDLPRGGCRGVTNLPGKSDITRSKVLRPRVGSWTSCSRPYIWHMSSAYSRARVVQLLWSQSSWLCTLTSPARITGEVWHAVDSRPTDMASKMVMSVSEHVSRVHSTNMT